MNYLTLKSMPREENAFDVYWSVWGEGAKLLKVQINDPLVEIAAQEIAELEVIRYLLQDVEVFGKEFSGRGLSVQTSNSRLIDAIGIHFGRYEGRYMTFLPIRYFNSVIEHDEAADNLDQEELLGTGELVVNQPRHVTIETELLGTVAITMNAVIRYISNLTDGKEMKDPFRSLKHHLQKSDLEVVDVESNTKLSSIAAFIESRTDIDLVATSPFSARHFLFSEPDRNGVRHLITVFVK